MKFTQPLMTLLIGLTLAEPLLITGAGATFPYPLYSKWFSEYQKIEPNVQLNYQSIGSGGGIRQFGERTIDFGATDVPMTDGQLAKTDAPVLHIPTVMGAVVLTYNLPGVTETVRFSPEVIADIFLGKIKKWNDPAIQTINPGIALSDIAIASSAAPTEAVRLAFSPTIFPRSARRGKRRSAKVPPSIGL